MRGFLGALLGCGAFVIAGACHQDVSGVALGLYAPQGLLDNVASMDLQVVDATGLECDEASGQVIGTPAGELQEFSLEQNCASGAPWCKTITLDKDGEPKLFRISGYVPGDPTPAVQGCAIVPIDQDPLEVNIQVLRFVPPKCCNDGTVQPTEQCDNGAVAPTNCQGQSGASQCLGIIPDSVCECDCLAKEILLSRANVASPTDPGGVDDNGDMVADNLTPPVISNNPGTKSELAMAFSGGSGQVANSLRAVFTDTENDGGEIDLRLLDGTLKPLISQGTFMKTLRLPRCTATTSGTHRPLQQRQPAIARVTDSVAAVVFANSEYAAPRFDVSLSPHGPNGCDDTANQPLQVNTSTAGNCEFPAVAAGGDGAALVVWNQGGAVRGRIWEAATNALTPAADIDIGTAVPSTRIGVAGNPQGWVVVFQGTGGVLFTKVQSNAALGTSNVTVNAVPGAEQPDVAMLGGGNFIVVWRAGDEILFQRYDESGNRLNETDQNAPLSGRSPPGMQPSVAAAPADAFYAVAWAANDGTIWARLVD
ncbi:MAG TPA: hypothetical protein VFB62_22355, partial [Polyangiaceae bacterium]|nr:hypothetical protein [Polyangiaceae bacterium]